MSEFMKTGFFMIVAGVADIYNNIFVFIKKCFQYSRDGYSNTFIKAEILDFWYIFQFEIKPENFRSQIRIIIKD